MPRRLGQHFLRDRSVLKRIVDSLALVGGDAVLEIGPGRGALTREIAGLAGSITAVELDRGLAETLSTEFCTQESIHILQADALGIEPCELMPRPYKLAGNIPYYITGALLRKFLTAECKPSLAVLMVQIEVARRIVAKPGEMSLLSVSTQLYSNPTIVAKVPARAFSPPPKVDSAVVKLEVLPAPRVPIPSEAAFFRVVRAGFGTKRKQLVNALAQGLGIAKDEVVAALEAAGIDGTRRAEDLALEEWGRIACLAAGDKR